MHLLCNMKRHHSEKTNPPIEKKLAGYQPPTLLEKNIFKGCYAIYVYVGQYDYITLYYSHVQVSMAVADGLTPIWRQVICNHHDDIGWSPHRMPWHNDLRLNVYMIGVISKKKKNMTDIPQKLI